MAHTAFIDRNGVSTAKRPVGKWDKAPTSLHAVVESALRAVGTRMPDADCMQARTRERVAPTAEDDNEKQQHTGAVLGARNDNGQLRVEAHGRDVVGVALERLHARLGLVVPNLDRAVRQ